MNRSDAILFFVSCMLFVSAHFGTRLILLNLHKDGYTSLSVGNLINEYEHCVAMFITSLIGSAFVWFSFYYIPVYHL